MVADSGDDRAYLRSRHTEIIEQSESHYSAALCMIDPVYDIADIMHDGSHLCKLNSSFVIAESFKDIAGNCRNSFNVGKGMFGISQRFQRLVSPSDIFHDIGILLDILISNDTCHL